MFDQLTQQLDHVLELGIPGFDCAVWHKGQCVYRRQNGFSDQEAQTPVCGTERIHLYSCSKPITCTAAMQLWEKGAFDLDAPLSRYLPEYESVTVQTREGIRPALRPITVRNLFTMTAGMSYNLRTPVIAQCRLDTDGRCPTREVARYLAREPLRFDPGDSFQYSLCHDVLAALVEVVSGQSFEDYVQEHIFHPLEMNRSTFLLPESELDTLAPQYTYKLRAHKAVLRSPANDFRLGSEHASGGAGCVSTVEDYMRFLEALRTNRLLKPETLALMTENQLTDRQLEDFSKPPYGYGLGMRCSRGSDGLTDFGWDGAAGCYCAVDPGLELSIFYAQHVLNTPIHLLTPGFLAAAQQAIREAN